MCFDHDDDIPDISEECIRKARKPYRCEGCRRGIEKGELYYHHVFLYDGEWALLRECGACRVDAYRIDKHEREVEGCKYPESMPALDQLASWMKEHKWYTPATREEGQAAIVAEIERRKKIKTDWEAMKANG